MAQGAPQLDFHVLQDLKQRFPEIPENVVSQCLLQNNNNLEVCCHLLAQESSRYLYEEFHSPEEVHLSRNRMLHISVGGFPPPESTNANANSNTGYTSYFMSDHARSASTPPPTVQGISPTYTPVPSRYMTPITLALSSSIPSAPQALQIPPGAYGNSGNALYMRPSPSQSPQPTPWAAPGAPVYSPSPYSTPPYQSPYSSPQHHTFLPISPPTLPNMPYQHVPYRPYMPTKSSMKNQIEITLDGRKRSNSPIPGPQGTLYMPNSPSPSSPSRAISMAPPPGTSFHPGVYLGGARPRPASSPQAGSAAYIKIKMGPGQQLGSGSPSPPVEAESLLNIVDQGEKHGAPAPILPISATTGSGVSHISHMPRRSSSGSDDYAYTQALLLHQRARMERLLKELLSERQKLEQLKGEVNDMEYDALQRRFRRVNSSCLIPRPEEITRVRTQNRLLQIDIDCTLKETDLLQSKGKFDPKAMNNFYDNIQPGPVVRPKKDGGGGGGGGAGPRPKPAPQLDEDFEGAQWNCESCTFLNHPALNRCEQCEMPRYT
ncbi:TGF-beta-activated kinase 1 and MAP3K7-binding protein 3 isoform X1 [Tachysurus vachellii]|uniref:TGF-beta-activated kinase 1 and MAP3K7-binding protein 3 isoform X1 n=1 Tax=Tachysurus vachellii TaxID=175792 RepID=UPI00296AF6F9|nr:TGF-beta-activated kinase 1 and MAP3K7-binding protein 3 isoform X1 [Tachysurus vachellii]XP_060736788.1 TGF-beta-activated kinase 1 and MAP3K7-binding protein 3 isoform X1 [Tachysurus vachellii]